MYVCLPGSGRVLDDGLDLSVIVGEPHVIGAVFLHGDGSLERTVANGKRDAGGRGLLDGLAGFVAGEACNHLSLDLEEGGRGRGERNIYLAVVWRK